MTKRVFVIAAVLIVAGAVLMISLGSHSATDGSKHNAMDISGLERSMDIHSLPNGDLAAETYR